jgi:hypothetical protein
MLIRHIGHCWETGAKQQDNGNCIATTVFILYQVSTKLLTALKLIYFFL